MQVIQALGQAENHVVSLADTGQYLLPQTIDALTQLQADASQEGFALTVASGFRSFARQLTIWNGKACGQRRVNDAQGRPLERSAVKDNWAWAQAILRWSALPGCSRHHWGTDIDIYDASRLPEGQALALTVEEAHTLFAELHRWLDERIRVGKSYGFYRPYAIDRGGIAPEPWHLSFAPIAKDAALLCSKDTMHTALMAADLELKTTVCDHWDDIYARYIAPNLAVPAD